VAQYRFQCIARIPSKGAPLEPVLAASIAAVTGIKRYENDPNRVGTPDKLQIYPLQPLSPATVMGPVELGLATVMGPPVCQ
jgi:hypothetical protein